jgi:hypothetical protein
MTKGERKMEPCIAYEELVTSLTILEENLHRQALETLSDRLEWLLARHNTDGKHGCDWCILAEEIRRLRAGLQKDQPQQQKPHRGAYGMGS